MKFSPADYTFNDFVKDSEEVLKQFDFINMDYVEYEIEDSVPWINIEAKRVIKPKEALQILEKLQAKLIDQVIFNSLSGRKLRIVVNGKFHMTEEDLTLGTGFDEEYAFDFGTSIEDMKKEYELN
jgi:hypothetical protein